MSKDCRTISEPKWPCYFGCCKTEKTFNWGVPNLSLRLLIWDSLRLGPTSASCFNKTMQISYGKMLDSPIKANCVYYPRPRSYDCFDWESKQLEKDLNLARSEAITRVSFTTLTNQAELPMKLSPRAMNMYLCFCTRCFC